MWEGWQWCDVVLAAHSSRPHNLPNFTDNQALNVYWYAVLHAILTGPPALLCMYLDAHASRIDPGSSPEPLRSIKGAQALTPLHSLVPMISLGYGLVDLVEGIYLKRYDYVIHGLSMLASMGSCCFLGKSHLVTPALIMELSSVPLNVSRVGLRVVGG